MVVEELFELVVFEFLFEPLSNVESEAAILDIVLPKLVDLSTLSPLFAFVFVVRMSSILSGEKTKAVRHTRI